jgi:dUTPase
MAEFSLYDRFENYPTISFVDCPYEKVMLLKIYVDSKDTELKEIYLDAVEKHNNKIFSNNKFEEIIDAGFDIYTPKTQTETGVTDCFGTGWENKSPVNKIDFNIKCSSRIVTANMKYFNSGYYMFPRSSLSKTKLRLANSLGIIDAGYRGNLIGMFDVVNVEKDDKQKYNDQDKKESDYKVKPHERLVQICAPGLIPIIVKVVNSLEELGNPTKRGEGGFGSTN